jgi:hypothetical protein
MGLFLERLYVESVPGLYCTKKFGHPVKGLCVPLEGAPTLLEGELASDNMIQRIKHFIIMKTGSGKNITP